MVDGRPFASAAMWLATAGAPAFRVSAASLSLSDDPNALRVATDGLAGSEFWRLEECG